MYFLLCRHIVTDKIDLDCFKTTEDIAIFLHALWNCSFARRDMIWQAFNERGYSVDFFVKVELLMLIRRE